MVLLARRARLALLLLCLPSGNSAAGACSQALRQACPPEGLSNQTSPLPRCEACVRGGAGGSRLWQG
eukprot:SAG22_NODE_5685_length_972_cov_0.910653_1_plen_67_part_00